MSPPALADDRTKSGAIAGAAGTSTGAGTAGPIMGMNRINLIPAPRLAERRRRQHLRYCVAGCAAWGMLSLAAACMAHAVWRPGDPEAARRLAEVNQEVQQTERASTALRAKLAAAQSTLRANQAIACQPDWSILLGLLGQQVGDRVVLKSCNVRPSTARAAAQAPRRAEPRRVAARPEPQSAAALEAPPFVLEASGIAVDHASANEFVLRLEQTGLFSRVSLLDTAREPFFDKNAIAFRLECALNQAPVQERAAPANRATAAATGGGDS